MAKRISDPGLRAWLLLNMAQDEGTGKIGWKANIEGIYAAFKKHIGN
jgi:hypothetical protein